jgi:hypothetical protein
MEVFFKIKNLSFPYVFLKNSKVTEQNFARFRVIPQHWIPFNSAKFLLIPYIIRNVRKRKKVQNSVLTELRKHSIREIKSFLYIILVLLTYYEKTMFWRIEFNLKKKKCFPYSINTTQHKCNIPRTT